MVRRGPKSEMADGEDGVGRPRALEGAEAEGAGTAAEAQSRSDDAAWQCRGPPRAAVRGPGQGPARGWLLTWLPAASAPSCHGGQSARPGGARLAARRRLKQARAAAERSPPFWRQAHRAKPDGKGLTPLYGAPTAAVPWGAWTQHGTLAAVAVAAGACGARSMCAALPARCKGGFTGCVSLERAPAVLLPLGLRRRGAGSAWLRAFDLHTSYTESD